MSFVREVMDMAHFGVAEGVVYCEVAGRAGEHRL